MRENLRRLYEWAKDWQMLFNVDKCSVMHMGRGSKFKYDYRGSNSESLRGREGPRGYYAQQCETIETVSGSGKEGK